MLFGSCCKRLQVRQGPGHYAGAQYCKTCGKHQTFSVRPQGPETYFLSEAFRGKYIAVRESHLPGQITLLFRQFRIGRIDLEKRAYTMKRIYRLVDDPRENV